MSVFDLIIFAILIALAFRGWMTGMVAQIVSVGSLAVSWVVASRFAFLFAPSIPAEEPWNKIGAMIVLFIITLLAVRLAHRYLEKKIKDWNLAKWNRHLGGLLGLLKGLILCMVLTFFGVMLSEATREVVFKSKSGNHLARLIEKTETFIPSDSCELLRRQLESFNAKINETNINGTNISGTEIFTNLSPEEKSLQKMREFLPSGQDFQEQTKSNLNNLIAQGNSLIEQAQNIQQGTSKAASLLDALGKWWTGSGKEDKEDKEEPKTEETGQMQNTITDTDKITNTTVLPLVSPRSELISEPTIVLPEQPVRSFNPPNRVANFSSETGEKTLFGRRFSRSNQTMTEPVTQSLTTTTSVVTTLPELSVLGIEVSDSELPDIPATPIPISRSSVPFRLRTSAINSSDRLLQSSPTRVPATLFTTPKR
ncbi:MAG: CvpA family protein [Planctomycetaceae bacterium]|jgi:membrane protein required for colicin V production|nr:CvpA family protein [Planctomycetaceae bacterium]